MGIAKFFKYVSDSNKAIEDLSNKFIEEDALIDESISRLYIDFNGIIFDVLAEHPENDKDSPEDDEIIQNHVVDKIKLYRILFPNAKIYIFLESIPTISKIKEQYGRRIYDKIIHEIEDDLKERFGINEKVNQFNRSKFGFNLEESKFMRTLIQKIKNKSEISNLEVNSYDSSNPIKTIGEAEHKILTHIIEDSTVDNGNYIILSADADIILLSIIVTNKLSPTKKVNVLRRYDNPTETTSLSPYNNTRRYYLINIQKLIDFFYSKNTQSAKTKKNYITDLIFVFNVLGDDFIPTIQYFNTSFHMQYIFNSLNSISGYILEDDSTGLIKKINLDNLIIFFSHEELINIRSSDIKGSKVSFLPCDINENLNILTYNYINTHLSKGIIFTCNESNSACTPSNVFPFDSILKANPDYKLTNPIIPTGLNLSIKKYNNKIIDKYISDLIIFYKYPFTNQSINTMILNNKYKKGTSGIIQQPFPKYDFVSLIKNDNLEPTTENTLSDDILINYLEGYTFILDLYINLNGKSKNNFWFYKYDEHPTFTQIRDYLIKIKSRPSIPFPEYDKDPKKNYIYFDYSKYKSYLWGQINKNIKLLKTSIGVDPDSKLKYENLYSIGAGNLVFNCKEKIYLNKCLIKNIKFSGPFEWFESLGTPLQNNFDSVCISKGKRGEFNSKILISKDKYYIKYLKYKNKYLELKKTI